MGEGRIRTFQLDDEFVFGEEGDVFDANYGYPQAPPNNVQSSEKDQTA